MVGTKYTAGLVSSCITLLAISGCTSHYTSLAMVSTRPEAINIDGYELAQERVVGKDQTYIIVFFPTGTILLERAVEDALNKSGGDLLVNVTSEVFNFYIPYIYGTSILTVRGDSLRRKKSVGQVKK